MLLNELRQVPMFADLPDDQLNCVADQGTEIHLEPGSLIANQGDPADGFYIILEGWTLWSRTVDSETVPTVKLGAGDIFAELILLLDEPYPTTGWTLTKVRLYKLTPDGFWTMLDICPSVRKSVLKTAAQRSQIHETVTQQQAKLMSLGTLSAGLAHELNNPAAAMRRSVQQLETILQTLPSLALKLHRQPIEESQLHYLSNLYTQATATTKQAKPLDPLSQSEREEEVADWLDDHAVANGWKLSPMLVTAGIEVDRLDDLLTHIDPSCLGSVLTWLESTLTGMKLLDEIILSSTRIAELIKAMKDYSYLDQAPLQEIDLHEGIDSTLTILKHKLKHGVTVHREFGDLPRICAHGRELNQVWTNLIDNAIDAMQGKGTLTIRTSQPCADAVVVEICDTGTGIPENVRDHIFEPFFTTKGVGAGTGLGLDIARRIVVRRHHGAIGVESEPGNTRFQVRLPINPKQSETKP